MKNKFIFFNLAFLGILYRFYYQFLLPSFNVDEIALGKNIKNLDYFRLLFPLENNQSSPPLYLWLQKFLFKNLAIEFWINAKILSFVVSSLFVLFFLKFIQKQNFNLSFLVPYFIALFNPFVIYNSLTLKQYGFDMLGLMLILVYFKTSHFRKYAFVYFVIWSLISNIGLFASVAYLLFLFFHNINFKNNFFRETLVFIKKNWLLILSPLPYCIYFLWFLQQVGAKQLQDYMTLYWQNSFMPINSNCFYFWISQIHNYWSFFFSMTEFVGVLVFLFTTLIFILQVLKKLKVFLYTEILFCSYLFGIHIFLSILHLYPMSDRLYLYLIILFLLLFTSSIDYFKKRLPHLFLFLISGFTALLLFSYSFYFDYKENDIVSLYEFMDKTPKQKKILTNRVTENCLQFDEFIENNFGSVNERLDISKSFQESNYIISRVHNKIKPGNAADEELQIKDLLKNNKIKFLKNIDGFNIYTINQN